jgi:DNA-binding transcriptional LysR family regulator
VLAEPLVIFPRRIVPSLYDAIFSLYHAAGRLPQVSQEAIQMQTIVNLVSAGLGVAWVPESVRQFKRSGIIYRDVRPPRGRAVPSCETSMVWTADARRATLASFMAFISNTAST